MWISILHLRAVHPRVCGELALPPTRPLRSRGSSPRVRGTHAGEGAARRQWRFIPACAGNSEIMAWAKCHAPVHPRVCGELMPSRISRSYWIGSSPRVRGTHVLTFSKTIPESVHPRVCGELTGLVNKLADNYGSSPRVRGTRAHGGPRWGPARFIPACAGNSGRAQPVDFGCAVHPRVCGELGGSGRGTARSTRFIPACAGNSLGARTGLVLVVGSSPRVRGTPLC